MVEQTSQAIEPEPLELRYEQIRRRVLVVAENGAAGEAAVAMAGARLIESVPVIGGADRLSTQVGLDVVLIDARGAEDAAVTHAAALAQASARVVVVAFAEAQIDAVASPLLGSAARLLCDPAPAELALTLASDDGREAVRDINRDESERLRMLNDEVARIAETLARLTRGDAADRRWNEKGMVRDRQISFGMPEPVEVPPVDPATVRALIRARRLRSSAFATDLFADPAWDMLLDLYAAELEHDRVSVSSLCIAAAVPGTTALRWIGTMIDAGLFVREADPFDRRRAFVRLTDQARDSMARYFASLRRAGLAGG